MHSTASERFQLRSEPDAERAIIGALLLSASNGDAQCADIVFGAIQPHDIVDPSLRTLYTAAQRLHKRGDALEPTLWLREVDDELPRDEAATLLRECGESVATTATIGSYVRLVVDASRQRRLVCAANDALNAARSARTRSDIDKAATTLRASLDAIDGPHRAERSPAAVEAGKPFPVAVLPLAIGDYVAAASAAIGCDPSFVALPLLGCLARAIGNKRTIKLKRTWTELPIIWAAIIGKSGTHKTPAIQAATHFLDRTQSGAMVMHAETLATYEQDKALYDRAYQTWRRSKSTEPPPWPPQEPVCERYIVGDITIEALADRLAGQYNGVLVARDELAGWLDGIAEYKGGKGSDTGHWLACWSGVSLTVDRKTGAQKMLHVPRAAVNIVGGIQPGVLKRAIGREHLQDGLCARLLLAMPELTPIRWTDAIVDPPIEAALAEMFDRLLELEPAADEDGQPAPFAMPLTPEAKTVWVEYYNRHRAEMSDLEDDLAAAWSKLEAYAARFALIFHLCSWAAGDADGEMVDESSVRAGITLADWFGSEARRVYGVLAESDNDCEHRELVELVRRKGGSLTARELMRSSRRLATSPVAEAALDALVRAGWGRWEVVATSTNQKRVFRLLTPSTPTDSPETRASRECVNVNAVNGAAIHSNRSSVE